MLDNDFLRIAWSAKTPEICPACHEEPYETSMHPCDNGDWTCRCMVCGGLLYRVTRNGVLYGDDARKAGA